VASDQLLAMQNRTLASPQSKETRIRASLRIRSVGAVLALLAAALPTAFAARASAATLTSDTFKVQTGTNGEISSLQLVGDAFPTNYVLNATNAPGQNTADHEWLGELMFSYRFGTSAWQTALTQSSADGRTVTTTGTSATITYQNSANANGVKNFKVVETYSLANSQLSWQIALTNTGTQTIEFGDVGLPLPFNEYWFQDNDVIYETRTVYHSFTGNSSSYITIQRPSGVGPFLLMVPDATTGAGFEYMDNWVKSEHQGSAWAAGGGTPSWPSGLDVFYIHSNQIKKTNRGYLPNTSLTLAAGASQTYGFKFLKVASHADVQTALYNQGLVDVTAVPGMMFATDMTAKVDLHTSKVVNSLTAQYPAETTITSLGKVATDHNTYQIKLAHLGPNNITVSYGSGEMTTLQFYALEPIDAALQRHATFMVNSTVSSSGTLAKVFDDWMMDPKSRRGAVAGGGWGDDWGWTKGEFLAEKNAQTPVAAEVTALDNYLDAVWANAIDHNSYIVQDWWCPAGTSATNIMNCYYDRAYAYPHAFNTYFSMYKVAKLYPGLVTYHSTADAYLLRAYNILHTLYSGHGSASTGYMGEQTLPDIMLALTDGGHTTEAAFVKTTITNLHNAFNGSAYPYGSEYTYDNTGEEAVYMAAKQSNDTAILGKVNVKTRACRGQEPTWYYYADPVTLNGENWWQFQYTAALAGYCMDDYLRHYSTTPELDERLSYAAKIANISAINSGQMDTNAANLGTVSWTYQAMKGNVYVNSFDPANGQLHNGWREMAGEADLGLFGAVRILSADVAVDPIFGLFGYGSDVSQSGTCTSVTPRDGVFKRLNLITQKFHMDLDRDRYKGATVSQTNNYLGFTLQNQTGDAHSTHLTLEGLPAGSYAVTVGGTAAAAVTATAGKSTVVTLAVGAGATSDVTISGSGSTCTGVGGATGGGTAGAGGTSGGAGTTGMGGAAGGVGGGAVGGDGSIAGAGTSGGASGAGTVGGASTAGGAGSGIGGSNGGAGTVAGGGTAPHGGTSSAGATGAGAGSGTAPPGSSGSDSGCSCRVGSGRGQTESAGALVMLGLASALVRRRKTRAKA
jgi:MYXO-CTERM domain-containing protein